MLLMLCTAVFFLYLAWIIWHLYIVFVLCMVVGGDVLEESASVSPLNCVQPALLQSGNVCLCCLFLSFLSCGDSNDNLYVIPHEFVSCYPGCPAVYCVGHRGYI